MEAIKFGLELAVVFLLAILGLFVVYYKISEKILTKKMKSEKDLQKTANSELQSE
jgi:low temperature requirement protein LtrA